MMIALEPLKMYYVMIHGMALLNEKGPGHCSTSIPVYSPKIKFRMPSRKKEETLTRGKAKDLRE